MTRSKKDLVVSYNQLGFVVYDSKWKDGIDVFPDTVEGLHRLLEFGFEVYGTDLSGVLNAARSKKN